MRLEAALAPLTARIDSMTIAVRRDSGTARADSAYLRWHDTLAATAARVVRAFDDSAFQLLIWPDGARGQQLQQKQPRSQRRLDSLGVMADSLVRFLEAHGINAERAEGDTYFDLSERHLQGRVQKYMTAPTREYLRIVSLEQTSPSTSDAAITISWDQLSERLADTDQWLLEKQGGLGFAQVKKLRAAYLGVYLTGTDNTPVFDKGRLDRAVLRSYERYVSAHAATPSGRTIRSYLDILKANEYRARQPVVDFLKDHGGLLLPEVSKP